MFVRGGIVTNGLCRRADLKESMHWRELEQFTMAERFQVVGTLLMEVVSST